ncbi:MAG: ABC transporter substrate-binding protein [Oscillospiraceae bacterium]|nr:ABC transporter substrate-binding protein [Oscillospiraceae bacterium]
MKKRILALTSALLLTVGLLSGCSGKDEADVYWLNFKPEADAALQKIAKTYTQQTGVPVKVVTAASGQYETTLTAEMDKSAPPTLFVVGNPAAVERWSNYCYDLQDTDVHRRLVSDEFALYDKNGKLCSMGYCFECFGLIVNKALLEQAGYSVVDIRDFASLKRIAEDIHARRDELGFDAFTSSGLDDSSAWRFTGHLANMPLYWESQADGGWKHAPDRIRGTYLDNYKNIWDLYIQNSAADPRTLGTPGHDAQGEFGRQEAVFYQNGSWEYSALVNDYGMDPAELAMIPIYCGVEGEESIGLCCGTENSWAVNAMASEADIKATLDFMHWMVTSPEGTQVLAQQFGQIPYEDAPPNPNPFLNDAVTYLENGNTTVDWVFTYTPDVNRWRAGLASALTQYSSGGDWERVRTAFVEGWNAGE